MLGSSSESINTKWNVVDVSFFDFHYDDKFVAIALVVKHVSKNIYFQDVHVFLKRVKDITLIKNAKTIKINLYICLRNLALKWYTFILFKKQKFYVKYNDDVDHWFKALLKRWKKSSYIALAIVVKERYIMKNVRRRRKLNEYAQIIIRATWLAKMSIYN